MQILRNKLIKRKMNFKLIICLLFKRFVFCLYSNLSIQSEIQIFAIVL